jgi:hypothetical protein
MDELANQFFLQETLVQALDCFVLLKNLDVEIYKAKLHKFNTYLIHRSTICKQFRSVPMLISHNILGPPPLPLGGEKGWKRGVGGAADAENRDKKAK